MKTLVVLPSWGREKGAYKKLLATTPKGYVVYILSYEFLCPDRKIENIEINVINFFKSKKLKLVELLGHSLGGTIAIPFAVNHPEYVAKLILVDAKAFTTHSHVFTLFPTQRENLRVAGSFSFAYELVFKTAFRIISNPLLHGKLGFWAIKTTAHLVASEITVSTLIMWGEKDISTPLEEGKNLHQLIPNSKLLIVPSGSHEWILHKPEYLWEALERK